IVTFTKNNVPAEKIKAALATKQINVSVSQGSGNLISFKQRGLTAVVRASVHYYNTEEEIDTFISALQEIK
ncbi:MAG: aminotransferase class V-fold PLP-dependent enzyme, partial [Chloroflexota bacterium]